MIEKIREEDFKDQELITSNSYVNESTAGLKEQFVNEYSIKMGWDRNNLTDEQLIEIHSQKGYQCPGMITG